MRRFSVLVLTAALVLSGIVASPSNATIPSNGFYDCNTGQRTATTPNYTITYGVVTNGKFCEGAVVLPEGITAIGTSAFGGSQGLPPYLSSITIPKSVTEIRVGAFAWSGMETVTFAPGSKLETIGSAAFEGNTRLVNITLPPNLTSIGGYAFSRATSLVSITIPKNVTAIGEYSFKHAFALASVTFESDSKLTYIGTGAFTSTGPLTPVTNLLTSITIPASVTSIGNHAFENNEFLSSVTFAPGSKLEIIGDLAFCNNPLLTSITIPASVTSVRSSAFLNNTLLSSVTFERGSKLETIGNSAFAGTSLSDISIPASVTSIGQEAFSYSTTLATVAFEPGSKLETIGNSAFAGTSLSDISIPASVTSIGQEAFMGSDLSSVTIPANVRNIGNGSFSSTQLQTAYLLGNPTLGILAFGDTFAGAEIVSAPNPPSLFGYTFLGWSESHGGNVITFPYRPNTSSAIVLYAKWIRNNEKAAASVKPSITGTAKASKTLAAKKGTWTGYPAPTVSYQWFACSGSISTPRSTVPTSCKRITGATKSTFKIARAQKGKFISVLVTGVSTGTSKTTWLTKSTSKVK